MEDVLNTNTVRRRKLNDNDNNGNVKQYTEEKPQDDEFVQRDSPLTVLIENSLHIKAIYHIFVVILVILLCDTVIYDLIESGKINIGISTVRHGFGDIRRGVKLWLYELCVALIFYPLLEIYDLGARLLIKQPELRRIWNWIGVVGVVGTQITLFLVPLYDLGQRHLALGSSIAVTCEMFRFGMKIHATAVVCEPRCNDPKSKIPTFRQYVYFLFAPTLIYRDEYPRSGATFQVTVLCAFIVENQTKKIRWGVVMTHFLEVAAIIFYNSFMWERFILPYWSDYGKEPQVLASTVIRGMFACILPGVISFLCGFYCLLHAWHNAFAELLTFGDRLFYEEWWTASLFSRYFRAWNKVVHSWIRTHVYKPLAPRTGRTFAMVAVFLISAVAHELILAVSFGFFYPVLSTEFTICALTMMPMTAAAGRRFPGAINLFMWLSFFVGNGMLWSLYPMEYFARKNCPPSENDSYFIPKSWSCPEIVIKPNWTFHNPFTFID